MDILKSLLFLVVGGITVFFAIYISNDKLSAFANDEILSGVNANKENIKQIKHLLQTLQSTTNTPSQKTSEANKQLELINRNIQKIEKNYSTLSHELQSLKQQKIKTLALSKKEILSDSSSLNSQAVPATPYPNLTQLQKQEENTVQQHEDDWLSGADDSIETTSIQSKLNDIFSDNSNKTGEEVTISNVECKTNSCKVTLNYSDNMETSPIMTLIEQDSFSDKDIQFNKAEDPATGIVRMTLYIKSVVKDYENDIPSIPLSVQQ